ncbi:NAD-dependent epimerase/dehydratase family protein [Salsipaludibacter albus]|uniref:NAD-dependent epimerase/dehydratase family protein n=1 Tax=Salsipaludibacter albus TaxID=2849650 RepID=UPI001EE41CAE|nr:NAD(P)-dependent oxidoreductase [Salsipaludibacter albus]MBY5162162.1 NAD(P)-dependent oxidoreductase [Salsipaludibacter albus]
MEIFVTGATGVLGRRVLPDLVAAGHAVTAVARSHPEAVLAAGATPVQVDLFDPATVRDVVDGHEAVVDLATSIPPTNRMIQRSAWRMNDRLRTEASANLADAVLAVGTDRYVRESYFGVFADGGDGWVDDTSAVDPVWPALTALDGEASARRVTAAGHVGVALRFAQFVGPDAGHTRDQVTTARRWGIAPFFGDPDGYLPTIHLDDAAAAVVAALDAPAGTWIVADDRPLRRREHAEALSAAVGRRLRLPPRWISRVGPLRMLDRSVRLDAGAFRDATGWAPTFLDAASAWHQVVAAIDSAPDLDDATSVDGRSSDEDGLAARRAGPGGVAKTADTAAPPTPRRGGVR